MKILLQMLFHLRECFNKFHDSAGTQKPIMLDASLQTEIFCEMLQKEESLRRSPRKRKANANQTKPSDAKKRKSRQ